MDNFVPAIGEIQMQLSRYCRYLDDGETQKCVLLFTQDAVMFSMGQELRGREAIAAFFPASEKRDRLTTMHILSNCLVDLDGDTASAETDWVMLARATEGKGTVIGLAGRYRDRLRYEGNEWLICERRIVTLAKAK
jgi:ketosteroid isomerase-like protein